MKTLHKLMTAGAVMAFAGIASSNASTVIGITGSTAFRKATIIAIMKLMGSTDNTTLPAGSSFAYSGSTSNNVTGANAATFIGTIAGNAVTVRCSWAGSAGGVQSVAGHFQVPFINASANAGKFSNTFDPSTAPGGPIADPTGTSGTGGDFEFAEVNMSDTFQATSPFHDTYNGVVYASEVDHQVGVVPFKWCASAAAPAGLTNMTPQLAQATWVGVGACPLALYTGNSADQGTFVFATGRDADSGTRLTALSESGIGGATNVVQYDASNGNIYPDETINGIAYTNGNGGEASGGNLATKMFSSYAASNIFVTYLGTNDASKLLTSGTNPGKELTWNGVAYSDSNIKQGKYTFWGYEHLYYLSSLTGTAKTVADTIANQIKTVDATQSGYKISDLSVKRDTDGGVVYANY
jgi:hypothetical protein